MKKVLIVDDEPMVLQSTQRLLAALGFQTATVTEPADILDVMRREQPHVVLQDVRMPGLDLETLIASVRADPILRPIPVILFSAGMDLLDLQRRVRASGVLEKPFKPQEILEAISSASG